MDCEDKKIITALQDMLDKILSGSQCSMMKISSPAPEWQKLIGQMNQLAQNLNEINRLALDLSEGKLECPVPPRHNYLAGPLKQLHSQLSIMVQSGSQLQAGYVISKLEGTGELFEMFNGLIDQVAAASMKEIENTARNMPRPVTSWRYHQILRALDLLHISVLEVDCSGSVVYANRPAKQLLGNIEYLLPGQVQDNALLELIAELGNQEDFPIFREAYDCYGSAWYRIMVNRFFLPNNQMFYLYVVEDISDWKISEHQLKLSAATDEMTGACNRKSGLDALEKLLGNSEPVKSNCLAFIDIDGLKAVNDRYGHKEGDYVIKSIAKVLLSFVRSSDVVCRYGGDEFFIIFKRCTEASAEKIIIRMCDELKKLNRKASKPYMLSFSYGIAPFSTGFGANYKMTDLLLEADQKMYRYKKRRAMQRV